MTLLALVPLAAIAQSQPASAPAPHPTVWFPAPTEYEQRIETQLTHKIAELKFDDTPFDQVIDALSVECDSLLPEWQAIVDVGVDKDVPITYHAKNVELREALKEICDTACADRCLGFRVMSDGVHITSTKRLDGNYGLVTRCYPVGDIVGLESGWKMQSEDQAYWYTRNAIVHAIQYTVAPDEWEVNGGFSACMFWGTSMAVRAPREVHAELVALLEMLRAAAADLKPVLPPSDAARPGLAGRPLGPFRHKPYDRRTPEQLALDARLDRQLPEITVGELPLDQVFDFLGDFTGVQVRADWRRLSELGIDRDKPIWVPVRSLTARQYLNRVLREAEGTEDLIEYQQRGAGIYVTDRKAISTRVYVVADLVVRHDPPPTPPTSQPDEESDDGSEGSVVNSFGPAVFETVLFSAVTPDEWESNGGRGIARFIGPLLIVRKEMEPGPDEIETLLDALAASAQADRWTKPPAQPFTTAAEN